MGDTKQIDEIIGEECRLFHNHLMFVLRDKAGVWPVKIRTTVFTHEAVGLHSTEVENIVVESPGLEESYERVARDMAMREAEQLLKHGE